MSQFEKSVIALYGKRGEQWLADLPKITERLARRWGLSDLEPVASMNYNYILSGTRAEQPIILKIGPDPDEPREELKALQLLAGPSVTSVLEYDLNEGAFLLKRAVPGTTLDALFPGNDDEALQIVCDLIRGFARVEASEVAGFDLHAKWFTVLDEECAIPERYLFKARKLEKLLIATMPQPLTLCHADLYHGNILQDGDRWMVIDPFPALAESAFEVAHFIWNPYRLLPNLSDSELYALFRRRILFAVQELQADSDRIERWCFVKVITAWAWFLKSGRETMQVEQLAHFLDPLTPDDLETLSPLLSTSPRSF